MFVLQFLQCRPVVQRHVLPYFTCTCLQWQHFWYGNSDAPPSGVVRPSLQYNYLPNVYTRFVNMNISCQLSFWREIGRRTLPRTSPLTVVPMLSVESIVAAAEPPFKKFCKMPTDNVTLQFAKLTDKAMVPTRGSKYAAGYDLYSAYDYTLPARGKIIAKTDIQIALPEGTYGRVAPRSGLAAKHFIDVGAGVIDQDYRGNVGVVMFNFSEKDFEVKSGDRIAQLICERIYIPELVELEKLDDTDRGSGGFGSTGTN